MLNTKPYKAIQHGSVCVQYLRSRASRHLLLHAVADVGGDHCRHLALEREVSNLRSVCLQYLRLLKGVTRQRVGIEESKIINRLAGFEPTSSWGMM
jgi:hypothetical protein